VVRTQVPYEGIVAPVLFNSFVFVAFFAVVYGLYCVLRHRAQNVLLLVASYVFYGSWDWRFLSLILLSTVVDYACGLGLVRASSTRGKRLLLSASVVTNLGILFTFKYFGFFAESFGRLLGLFGLSLDIATVNVVLPVGISFYTFQTMSYTIDIYRGKLAPTRDFLNFALFVAFFPQLVAGPIERARSLLPQVEAERRISSPMVHEGLWLLLLGYFKKLVIADNMIPFTEPIFGDPESASGMAIVVGIYAFAFQIYGDFSGYSDIARGLGKLMGFEIMLNFRFPYFATNPRDFWNRWHISLSTWLRDYLYVPLGGNRHGRAKTERNLMLTMLLGGLWHGAAWNFVAWGFFHGGLLIAYRRLEPRLRARRPADPGSAWRKIVVAAGFFQITCIGWLLFAVHSVGDLPLLLSNVSWQWSYEAMVGALTIALFAGPLLAAEWLAERSNESLVVWHWSRWARIGCYVCVWLLIVVSGWIEQHEFIYFQF